MTQAGLPGRAVLWVLIGGTLVVAGWASARFFGGHRRSGDTPARVVTEAPVVSPFEGAGRLRFAVATMISVESTFSTYRELVKRISRDVGHKESFVLRPSYAGVRRDLAHGRVDVAFVCTGTYVHMYRSGRIKLLVQPEFDEWIDYRALFIVPAGSPAKTLEDLRGRVMAFADPESNTGRIVPSVTLMERGWHPQSFFKRVIFTGSHDKSIDSVAEGIVDVASVDSLVWESAKRDTPSLAKRVRVIRASEPFGPPPVLIPAGLGPGLEVALREAFCALDKDDEGRRLLSTIGIKRFVPARPKDYATAIEIYRRFQVLSGKE